MLIVVFAAADLAGGTATNDTIVSIAISRIAVVTLVRFDISYQGGAALCAIYLGNTIFNNENHAPHIIMREIAQHL
jgi:hypothetical protein